MEISMIKQMASQWDLLLVLCSPMFLCAPLKITRSRWQVALLLSTICGWDLHHHTWYHESISWNFSWHLNHCHQSAKFTMEVERNASLPFIGVELLNLAPRIKTKVYVKPTNTGLLLHYQSHVDNWYKRSQITTMLDRAYHISSDWSYFSQECDRLETVFLKLKYPKDLFNLAVKQDYKVSDKLHIPSTETTTPIIRVIIPFKEFAWSFYNIDLFSETFTTPRWWVSYVRNVKKMGGHRLHFGENMPGRTPRDLKKSGFVSEHCHCL